MIKLRIYIYEFCYSMYNQREPLNYLNLMIKNMEVRIERYLKQWISIKLVWY
jgi:hypothetical protein